MNYPDSFPVHTKMVTDGVINHWIREGFKFLIQNNSENIFTRIYHGGCVIIKRYKNNKQCAEYEITVSQHCKTITISEDKLIGKGLLPKPLNQAKIGDMILASNDKKYKILDSFDDSTIWLVDIAENKIVEGWDKTAFFEKVLTESSELIADSDIYPVKIIE